MARFSRKEKGTIFFSARAGPFWRVKLCAVGMRNAILGNDLNFCVRHMMPFIEAFARLRISLFRYVFCRNPAKFVIFVQFYTTVVTMFSLSHILLLTNSSSTLRLSESQGMFYLGQNSGAKSWRPVNVINPCSPCLTQHAVSPNQSGLCMETLL